MKKLIKKANEMSVRELAAYIDYSVLKPEFTEEDIINLTKDGVKLGCATICINPGYMELCEPYVKGSDTMLCVGLDPNPARLPKTASGAAVPVFDFCRDIIDVSQPKPGWSRPLSISN